MGRLDMWAGGSGWGGDFQTGFCGTTGAALESFPSVIYFIKLQNTSTHLNVGRGQNKAAAILSLMWLWSAGPADWAPVKSLSGVEPSALVGLGNDSSSDQLVTPVARGKHLVSRFIREGQRSSRTVWYDWGAGVRVRGGLLHLCDKDQKANRSYKLPS